MHPCSSLVTILTLAVSALAPAARAQTTWYVDHDNCPGPGSGTHEDPFCNIQDGIDAAQGGDSVQVASGTYAGAGNKNLDFGGKNITVRSENGPDDCVIDCQGNGRGFYLHSGEGPAAAIEGFTVTNAYADLGAAFYCAWSASPRIADCLMLDNSAEYSGGGLCLLDGNPTIEHCAFVGNTAGDQGGALYSDFSSPAINNCTFAGNSAGSMGGGICVYDGNPVLIGCAFYGNYAGLYGGGVSNSRMPPPVTTRGDVDGVRRGDYVATLINCVFVGNSAGNYGGGLYNEGWTYGEADLTLVNCTIVDNVAFWAGNGVYGISEGNLRITNCTLWNGGDEVYNGGGSTITLSHNDVEGGYPGEGNINADPLFLRHPDPGPDQDWGTQDDDYGDLRLGLPSPCIDAGDNSVVTEAADFDGDPRIVDGDFDGAPVVDMGAYEFQIGEAIPAVSEWGVVAMILSLLTAGTIVFARMTRQAARPFGR